MRNAFFYSILLIMLFTAFAQSEVPNTDTSVFFSEGSLQIQKNLIVKPTGFVSSSTGAALEKYESIVTIAIRNVGSQPKNDLQITEDLMYVPPNVRYTFNIEPKLNDNYATWNIDEIGGEKTLHLRFSVPAIISQEAFENSDSPQIDYQKIQATLSSTQTVELGTGIKVSLNDKNSVGIANSFVQVKYPDKEVKLLETDNSGKVRIIAQELGTYEFSAPDYAISGPQYTKVVSEISGQQKDNTTEQVQKTEQKPQENTEVADSNMNLWIVILIVIALIVAYYVYKYLSAPIDEEDTPIPPAPATRPPINESPEQKGVEKSKEAQFETTTHTQTTKQEQQDTQSLIAKRKAKMQAKQTEDEHEHTKSNKQIEKLIGESKKEEPISPIAHGDEAEYKEHLKAQEETEKGLQEQIQTQHHQEPQDTTPEVDEDAIKRTIEELEQLREELKDKTDGVNDNLRDEIAELEDEEPAKIDSIVQSAKESQRENVLEDDIGTLLDEEKKKTKRSRGRPKGTTKKKIIAKKAKTKGKKKRPTRPPKKAVSKKSSAKAKKKKATTKAKKKKATARPPKKTKRSRGRPKGSKKKK